MSVPANAAIHGDEAVGLTTSAERSRGRRFPAASRSGDLVLRLAQAADEGDLKRLAALDEQPELSGEALLACVGRELVAAMALADGRVIADPFVATHDAVSLLELRAHQLVAGRLSLRGRCLRWLAASSARIRTHRTPKAHYRRRYLSMPARGAEWWPLRSRRTR